MFAWTKLRLYFFKLTTDVTNEWIAMSCFAVTSETQNILFIVVPLYYMSCEHSLSHFFVFSAHTQFSHFPSCFGTGVSNLNEPPSSFLLPPYYCGSGVGSIPLRQL